MADTKKNEPQAPGTVVRLKKWPKSSDKPAKAKPAEA